MQKQLRKIISLANLALVAWVAVFSASTCRKERFSTDPTARLSFNVDTLKFDTVFTSIGSATYNFKVNNRNNQSLKIDRIYLGGGDASPFRMNVDGKAASSIAGKVIAAQDSFYVFVEVTVDPNAMITPFIIEDSIVFVVNGGEQKIPLVAFGQNARFFSGVYVARGDTTWREGLPIVIYNSAGVLRGTRLTIEPGVKIYSHRGSALIVEGEVVVNGTLEKPVIFQGDRLEAFYGDAPGQWYGIYLSPGGGSSSFRHTRILNGEVGILSDSLPSGGGPKLKVEKCTFGNFSAIGLFGRSSSVDCINSLFYNCSQAAVVADIGGSISLTHVTIANQQTDLNRTTPSLIMRNADYVNPISGSKTPTDLSATVRNCIIWGGQPDEAKVFRDGRGQTTIVFESNIVHTEKEMWPAGNLINQDPKFKDRFSNDFSLDTLSPARDAGITGLAITDITDALRDQKPDIGCYERKE